MAGYRVRYTPAAKLVNELVEAADDRQLSKTIARYGRVDLLCVDELGYMELDRRGAELLFQVLTEREEKASVAIASNESFSGWTKTFTDPRLWRRHRRPAHLRRQHHRDRHRLLPARPPRARASKPDREAAAMPGVASSTPPTPRGLAELLQLLAGRLAADPARLAPSLLAYIGHPAYGLDTLRAEDLNRFAFLGFSDGEDLFGPGKQ